MIGYPSNWSKIGCIPNIYDIEKHLLRVLDDLECDCLAFSGGVDSAYMLWALTQIYGRDVNCFTIALNEQHPDYVYAKQVIDYLEIKQWQVLFPTAELKEELNDNPGDCIVREFFNWIESLEVKEIICCDGIDEFMGGYYAHLHNPTAQTYYDFMSKLQQEQFKPLDKNSRLTRVLLPYMDEQLIAIYNRFPLTYRFDTNDRKKVIKQLATGRIPQEVIDRRKYGFVDAMRIKE